MYVSEEDKGSLKTILNNTKRVDQQVVVITDGSKVLNIGDQGIGGQQIGLSIKDILVATAGFNPNRIIPAVFDIGTNNDFLL